MHINLTKLFTKGFFVCLLASYFNQKFNQICNYAIISHIHLTKRPAENVLKGKEKNL